MSKLALHFTQPPYLSHPRPPHSKDPHAVGDQYRNTDRNMATSSCPLLHKLPAELRLKIYEYTLAQESDIQLTYLESSHKLVRTKPLPLGPLTCLNLFLTSHQIRNESLPIFTSINNLKIITPILGQYLKLVQGQPLYAGNIEPILNVLQIWLNWSGGKPFTNVEIHIGTWFTWWERATSEVVAPTFERLIATAVGGSTHKAKVTVCMTVNWSAVPAARSSFEIGLPLWDIVEARKRVAVCIQEQKETIFAQSACLLNNIETCQKKFDDLFDILDNQVSHDDTDG